MLPRLTLMTPLQAALRYDKAYVSRYADTRRRQRYADADTPLMSRPPALMMLRGARCFRR